MDSSNDERLLDTSRPLAEPVLLVLQPENADAQIAHQEAYPIIEGYAKPEQALPSYVPNEVPPAAEMFVAPPAVGQPAFSYASPMMEPIIIVPAAAMAAGPYILEPSILSSFPVVMTCPLCSYTGPTMIVKNPGTTVWLWCLLMACFTGCCCIPFCVDSCQDCVHYCSGCSSQLGRYTPPMC